MYYDVCLLQQGCNLHQMHEILDSIRKRMFIPKGNRVTQSRYSMFSSLGGIVFVFLNRGSESFFHNLDVKYINQTNFINHVHFISLLNQNIVIA